MTNDEILALEKDLLETAASEEGYPSGESLMVHNPIVARKYLEKRLGWMAHIDDSAPTINQVDAASGDVWNPSL